MMNRLATLLIAPFAISLSSCGSTMKAPDIQQNPNPKHRYEITISVDGAPKPFDTVAGHMQYEVTNYHQCAPADKISGVHELLIQRPAIAFTRVDEHTYKGTIYTDLMQDSDYYGLGVCHWSLMAAIAVFNVKDDGVSFSPRLSLSDVEAQKPVDLYFPKKELDNDDKLRYPDGGQVLSSLDPKFSSDFFKITISAKEVAP